MKRRLFPFFIILIIGLCGAAFWFFTEYQYTNYTEESYRLFAENLEKGYWDKIEIKSNYILARDGITGCWCKIKKPESPLLEEYVRRYADDVTVEASASDVFNLVFDLLFYAVFFGVIIIAFRKFISPNTFKVVHNTKVKFDDVVGMDALKKNMAQIIEVMNHSSEYAKKGIRLPRGILLEGEPGNGKTLFAKALAGEAKVNFIPAKATDFESMFMAIGPLKVKLLFAKARRRAPCIVFIDEFDGIGTVRNYSGSALETENTRIVTALLNELDGFKASNGVVVIAATNSIHALDPALIRPGRFDSKFKVPYPDAQAREKLIQMYTKDKTLSSECPVSSLVKKFDGWSCAKIESTLNSAALYARQDGREEIMMKDIEAVNN